MRASWRRLTQGEGPFWVLRLGTCACLLGHAWEHLRWDAPFRALLWNQALMEGPVRAVLGLVWREYVENLHVDSWIQLVIRLFGLLYLAGAVAALTARPERRIAKALLITCALALGLLSVLHWMDHRHQAAQLIELAAQWTSPLLVAACAARGQVPVLSPRLLMAARLAVAATFLGHGLYAVGYYPLPGSWPGLLMQSLGTSEATSIALIRIAGVLDMLVVVGVLLPWCVRPALAWAATWGLLTAVARPWANFAWDFPWASLEQWLHEGLIRAPHAALPAFLWLLLRESRSQPPAPEPPTSSTVR